MIHNRNKLVNDPLSQGRHVVLGQTAFVFKNLNLYLGDWMSMALEILT